MIRLLLLLSLTAFAAPKKKEPAPPPAPPAPVVDPEAWRATQPKPGPESSWEAPVPTTFTLSNGIPVYLQSSRGLPLVSVRVVMGLGRETNSLGRAGLQALTANMLDEGTKAYTSADLASALAKLGAELRTSGGAESSTVALEALGGDRLGPSLDLLAEVVLNPRFDKDDFARVRQEVVDGIQAARSDPNDVARRAFAAQLWGKDHPYGTPAVGTQASVGALKLKDVSTYYKLWWHAGNAAIVVTGDVDQATIQAELEKRFGGWKKGKAVRPPVLAPAVPVSTRIVFVEQPGAVQTVLSVGTAAMPRSSSEFPAANVAGTFFGGMFSSRLNINLREEHGWTYGAFGGFSESRDYGTFGARSSVQADKTALALQEIFKELATAAGKAPTADELTMTRDYLLKSLPGNFETNGSTADSFAASHALGLKPEAWRGFVADTLAVTPEQAAAAAKKYFDSKRMLVVAVGPRTVTVEGKTTDVVAELKGLGYEFVESAP